MSLFKRRWFRAYVVLLACALPFSIPVSERVGKAVESQLTVVSVREFVEAESAAFMALSAESNDALTVRPLCHYAPDDYVNRAFAAGSGLDEMQHCGYSSKLGADYGVKLGLATGPSLVQGFFLQGIKDERAIVLPLKDPLLLKIREALVRRGSEAKVEQYKAIADAMSMFGPSFILLSVPLLAVMLVLGTVRTLRWVSGGT